MSRCQYLVCNKTAIGYITMNLLDSGENATRQRINVCQSHFDIMEIWIERKRPHITEQGWVYIGEFEEMMEPRYM